MTKFRATFDSAEVVTSLTMKFQARNGFGRRGGGSSEYDAAELATLHVTVGADQRIPMPLSKDVQPPR